jgi:hypothetical protein
MPDPGQPPWLREEPLLSDPFVRGLSRELHRARQVTDTGGTASQADDTGVAAVVTPPRPGFWARIIGQNATDRTLYSFAEVARDSLDSSTFVEVNGGLLLTDKAREVNLNQGVPLSAVAWMEPSPGGRGSMYDFAYSGLSGCPPLAFTESDPRCEFGILNVYTRLNTLSFAAGCPTLTRGPWVFAHAAGCCDCASGSGVGSGGSGATSGGGHSGAGTSFDFSHLPPNPPGSVLLDCCPVALPAVLHADITNVSGVACVDGKTLTLVWNATAQVWQSASSYDLTGCAAGYNGTGYNATLSCKNGPCGCPTWEIGFYCGLPGSCPLGGYCVDSGAACDPLHLTFSAVKLQNAAGSCGPGGTVRIDVIV